MKHGYYFLWFIFMYLSSAAIAQAKQGIVEGSTASLDQMSSLGDAIIHSDKNPLHIIYIHGIGAEGPSDSVKLQKSICKRVTDCTDKKFIHVKREWADKGVFSPEMWPSYEYIGAKIWTSKKEWIASAPFVDHYIIKRNRGKKDILVDEINWWPIVFPIKCRNIMAKEAFLSGLGGQYRSDCSRETKLDADGIHYLQFDWLEGHDQCAGDCPKPPFAAVFNHCLKNFPIDWGFADAMLAVGPVNNLLIEAIRQLYVKSVNFKPDGSNYSDWSKEKGKDGTDQEQFVFVTHSLGSYLALSALKLDDIHATRFREADKDKVEANAATNYIFERTRLIYFFANQISLLELANIQLSANGEKIEGANTPNPLLDMKKHIQDWANARESAKSNSGDCSSEPQIVAFSDPSDLLTFSVPAPDKGANEPSLDNVLISNQYVVNSWRILYLLEWPTSAHDDYDTNKHVLRVMMKPANHSCAFTFASLRSTENQEGGN